MRHGSLFSGIGGFDLAAQTVGFQNVFQVEIDEFCQKVLTKNFPNVQRFKDIKSLGNAIVPQVAIEIFQAIKFIEDERTSFKNLA